MSSLRQHWDALLAVTVQAVGVAVGEVTRTLNLSEYFTATWDADRKRIDLTLDLSVLGAAMGAGLGATPDATPETIASRRSADASCDFGPVACTTLVASTGVAAGPGIQLQAGASASDARLVFGDDLVADTGNVRTQSVWSMQHHVAPGVNFVGIDVNTTGDYGGVFPGAFIIGDATTVGLIQVQAAERVLLDVNGTTMVNAAAPGTSINGMPPVPPQNYTVNYASAAVRTLPAITGTDATDIANLFKVVKGLIEDGTAFGYIGTNA